MMNNIETILNSDFIISFGAFIEEKELKNSIVEAVKKNSAKFIYMHPVDNFDLKSWKNGWGEHNLLNGNALIDTVENISSIDMPKFFARPLHDTKSFSGTVFDKEEFKKQGIILNFVYPVVQPYPQLHVNDFVSNLSMIDILMNNTKDDVNRLLDVYRVGS